MLSDTYRKPVFEKVPLNWEEDMEMQSKFIDRKVGKCVTALNIDDDE